MTNETIKNPETTYSSDPEIQAMAEKMVIAVGRAGGIEPNFGDLQIEKMRKKATLAMKADPQMAYLRFRPGFRLRTYTGARDSNGKLLDETYGGEASIKENTTIYANIDPIEYPQDYEIAELRGKPIKGKFDSNGIFTEDPNGAETLYNEYSSDDADHPKRKYGIDPIKGQWTECYAVIPSYLVQIPENKSEVEVHIAGGKKIAVNGGDFLVVDALGNGKTSVQAIEKGMKERTYKPW